MVKGISRQVIVVHSPDPNLFEQAIFILRSGALGEGVTEDRLLQEARKIIHTGRVERRGIKPAVCALWAFGGAAVSSFIWLLATL